MGQSYKDMNNPRYISFDSYFRNGAVYKGKPENHDVMKIHRRINAIYHLAYDDSTRFQGLVLACGRKTTLGDVNDLGTSPEANGWKMCERCFDAWAKEKNEST